MFKLVTVSEGVCIPAAHFGLDRVVAFEHAVNARYSNRVLPDVGLVVGVWAFVHIGEQRLLPSCGSAVAECIFRLVVFAPFAGEAVFATIAAAAAGGLAVALPFFGVVRVPAAEMPRGSVWYAAERVWIWRPPPEEGMEEDTPQPLFMDVSNDSVVRVTEVVYSEAARTPPAKDGVAEGEPPMSIFGSLYDAVYEGNEGLGNPLWWEEEEVEEGEEAGEDEAGEEAVDEAEDADITDEKVVSGDVKEDVEIEDGEHAATDNMADL